MHPDQLAALVAVVETGSFEAAARDLHITPSAVSQRIKALERHWGTVLVVRAGPCRATREGDVLLRLARQVQELHADAAAQLDPADTERRRLAIVVNADSLAPWFTDVLAEAATWHDCTIELLIELEDHGTDHLRTGAAVGAVTSDPSPVPGCAVVPLGVMRYLPVCRPELRDRHLAEDGDGRSRRGSRSRSRSDARSGGRDGGSAAGPPVDWATLPALRFSAGDDLQHRYLRGLGPGAGGGIVRPQVEHVIPSSQGFAAAIDAGLGWGLLPELQVGDRLRRGDLVRLPGRGGASDHVDVRLSWQSWRLGSQRTTRLTAAVRHAAAIALRPA